MPGSGSWIQDAGSSRTALPHTLALAEGENITSIVIKSRRRLEERTKLTCS